MELHQLMEAGKVVTSTAPANSYDKTDKVCRKAAVIAGPMKLAAYTVMDPDTGEHGPLQFHMTYDNTVMAVMGESAAKLFAKFVTDTAGAFQKRVFGWANQCFVTSIVEAKAERNHRFLEEALELVQSLNTTRDEAHMLVDYVFGRPVGEPRQEMGGTMVTLGLLAEVHGLDMASDGERELDRILQPEVIEKIRAKQLVKPASSPLPGEIAA
jgi:hypothetical protein